MTNRPRATNLEGGRRELVPDIHIFFGARMRTPWKVCPRRDTATSREIADKSIQERETRVSHVTKSRMTRDHDAERWGPKPGTDRKSLQTYERRLDGMASPQRPSRCCRRTLGG